jgi:hypothetical protein
VVRIPHGETEIHATRVGDVASPGILVHPSEGTEDVPVRVRNHDQHVRVPIAAAVKAASAETIASAWLEKRKPMTAKLPEDVWKAASPTQNSVSHTDVPQRDSVGAGIDCDLLKPNLTIKHTISCLQHHWTHRSPHWAFHKE